MSRIFNIVRKSCRYREGRVLVSDKQGRIRIGKPCLIQEKAVY